MPNDDLRILFGCFASVIALVFPGASDGTRNSPVIHIDSFRAAATAVERFKRDGDQDSIQSCMLLVELPDQLSVRELEDPRTHEGIEFRLMGTHDEVEKIREANVEAMFAKFGAKVLYAPKGSISLFKWGVEFNGELALIYVPGTELSQRAEQIAKAFPEVRRIVADYPNARLQDATGNQWPAYFKVRANEKEKAELARTSGIQLVDSEDDAVVVCWNAAAFKALSSRFKADPVSAAEATRPAFKRYRLDVKNSSYQTLVRNLPSDFEIIVANEHEIKFAADPRKVARLDPEIRSQMIQE